jgi:hypothetical protein
MAEMREAVPQRVTLTETPPPPKESFSFGNRVHDLIKAGKAAVLSGFLGLAVIACTDKEQQDYPIIDAPTLPVAGVNVVHATEAPMSSQTATIESKETPKAEKTAGWTVINSAGINIDTTSSTEENSSGRSLDQDSKAILEIAGKFPLPEKFTVVLTNNYHEDRAEGDKGTIYIGRNRIRIETMQFETALELAHLLDAETNENNLLKYYTPEQMQILKTLREEILTDPVWGRDYPSVKKMLTGKAGAHVIVRPGDSPSQIAAGTDIDANGIWIEGKQSSTEQSFNPFQEDLQNSFKFLDESQIDKSEYESLNAFVNDNQNIINSYFEASPLATIAKEDFYNYINSDLSKPENIAWLTQTDSQAYLEGRFTNDCKTVVKRVTNMLLFEKYEKGELNEFLKGLSSDKQNFLKKSFEFKFELTDSEKFTSVIAATVTTNSPGPGKVYLETINTFNGTNRLHSAD